MNRINSTSLILIIFISSNLKLSAQDPVTKNSDFELQGDNIVIYYDLDADPDEEYEVQVFLLRESDQSFKYVPKFVSGDVGEGKFAGEKKKIVWEILKEFPDGLEGEDYYFEIIAEETGSSVIYYVGAALLAAGGAAALLLGGGDKETPSPEVNRASPPARP
jgi:hypothetical protein